MKKELEHKRRKKKEMMVLHRHKLKKKKCKDKPKPKLKPPLNKIKLLQLIERRANVRKRRMSKDVNKSKLSRKNNKDLRWNKIKSVRCNNNKCKNKKK